MRVEVRIDVAGAREAFARAPSVLLQAIDNALHRGALEVAREARRRAPKSFSTLTQSIHSARSGALDYVVRPGVNYAAAVEYGTRPGYFPPPLALLPWVRQKLAASPADALRLAHALARSIHRRGTRAQPFLAPAAEAKSSRVIELVRAGVAAGIAEAFG